MELLNKAQTAEQTRYYPPHFLLLLIKWAFLYGRHYAAGYQPLTGRAFNRLMNMIHEFDATAREPNDYVDVLLFFKTLSHQQFYLQHGLYQMSWVRPMALFGSASLPEYIPRRFEALTGVELDLFLDLASMLVALCVKGDGLAPVSPACFSAVKRAPTGAVDRFLRTVSLRFDEVKAFVERIEGKPQSWDYELHKESPFVRKPLLELNGLYYPFSRNLLAYSAEHFVYDLLKADSPNEFANVFGDVFESYVRTGLGVTGLNFVPESELRDCLLPGSKVVDFLTVDAGANVLIDAKGVEMHHLGRVTHLGDVLESKVKSSVTSAIVQANETLDGLAASNGRNCLQLASGPSYLLVVTYKPLYIGNGNDFVRMIGPERAESLKSKVGDTPRIPWSHMYFLDVDAFDTLVGCLEQGQSLGGILQDAVKADSQTATQKWVFALHLRDRTPKELPSHIRAARDLMLKRARYLLGEQ